VQKKIYRKDGKKINMAYGFSKYVEQGAYLTLEQKH
jgi:uncharacterized protein YxeA